MYPSSATTHRPFVSLAQRALAMLNAEDPLPAGPRARAAGAPAADSTDVAIEDWDDLCRSVIVRLAQVATPSDTGRRAGVPECVAALIQLHASALHEFERRGCLQWRP